MGQLLFIFTILLVLVLPGCRSAENYQGSISGFDEGTVAEVSQSVTNPVADPKEATKGFADWGPNGGKAQGVASK